MVAALDATERPGVGTIASRALRLRCPRCGEGHIFRRVLRYDVQAACERCGLVYDPNGESVAFMYLSTAFLTGVMFIVLITIPPQNLGTYRIGLVAFALLLYGVTMPTRKGIAIALTYFAGR
jgi:uncharacterized protein (DUF983 family)